MARIAFIDVGARREDWLDFTVSACQAASRLDTDLIILMAGFQPNSTRHPAIDLVEIYNVMGKLADAPIAIIKGLKKQNIAYELLRKSPKGYEILDDYVWLLDDWQPFYFQRTKLVAIGSNAEVPHYGGHYEEAQLANGRSKYGHGEEPTDVLITHVPPAQIIRDNSAPTPGGEPMLLEIRARSAELVLKPKFHFYSDIHMGVAETQTIGNAAPIDPRGELAIFDTETAKLFRVAVKVMSWKLKRPRKWPAGLQNVDQLSSKER